MREILAELIDRLDEGPVALARVIATTGGAPRAVGSAMAVTAGGDVLGSVSGGCVDAAIVDSALDALATGSARCEEFGVDGAGPESLSLGVGLTCGGTIEILVEPLAPECRPLLLRLAESVAAGEPVALATTLGEHPDRYLSSADSGAWHGIDRDVDDLRGAGRSAVIERGDCGEVAGQGALRCFVHTFASPRRLLLVGANDFVRALTTVGANLGYRVSVVDARPVFATPARFPDADEVIVDWPDRYLAAQFDAGAVDSRTAICVMTHDPKFDVPVLDLALRGGAGGPGFVGAMGSRTTHDDRLARLRARGVDDEALGRLRSPLGLDIGGHTPAETAISIAAQLIADRHGASGGALTECDGPIHRPR